MMPLHRIASARGLPAVLLIGLLLASLTPATAADDPRGATAGAAGSIWDEILSSVADRWSDLTTAIEALHIPDVSLGPVVMETRMACTSPTRDRPADCEAAAVKACNRNGFESGRSLTVENGEVCRGDQLMALHQARDERCKPKTWTTRMVCW